MSRVRPWTCPLRAGGRRLVRRATNVLSGRGRVLDGTIARVSRPLRVAGTLLLTAAAVAYLVWKVDLGTTAEILGDASIGWFALAAAIMILTVPVLAARWDHLLRAHGIHERLPWLTRAYFVAYTAGQLLPTALGGDAVRVFDTARRHAGRTAAIAGTVVLERGLGGAATVLLGAVAFPLALGHYDVSAYV